MAEILAIIARLKPGTLQTEYLFRPLQLCRPEFDWTPDRAKAHEFTRSDADKEASERSKAGESVWPIIVSKEPPRCPFAPRANYLNQFPRISPTEAYRALERRHLD